MPTFAYDYSNMYTRGWVRAVFNSLADPITDFTAAKSELAAVAGSWSDGTDLRLVRIDVNGTETFPDVTAKGSRGALPKDKKNS